MKISELISILVELSGAHGDIEIRMHGQPIEKSNNDATPCLGKPSYNGDIDLSHLIEW